jgi:hypothetical protein
MIPLADFEIHSNSDLVGDLWESWLVIVHKGCGAALGESDGYDMIDLETAVALVTSHTCDRGG